MAKKEKAEKKETVKCSLLSNKVITESSDLALDLYGQSRFGTVLEGKKLQLSIIEALYLLEKEKVCICSGKKKLAFEQLMKKAERHELNVWTRYTVFKDLRNRGYIVKTALKFGADFRVYERGMKPGEAHAKWIVYPVEEEASVTWYEFAAKTRVAHSTKKRLLIGIVDDEGDVTYYEIKWTRP